MQSHHFITYSRLCVSVTTFLHTCKILCIITQFAISRSQHVVHGDIMKRWVWTCPVTLPYSSFGLLSTAIKHCNLSYNSLSTDDTQLFYTCWINTNIYLLEWDLANIYLIENTVGTHQVIVLKRLSLQIKCQPVSGQKSGPCMYTGSPWCLLKLWQLTGKLWNITWFCQTAYTHLLAPLLVNSSVVSSVNTKGL